MVDKGDDSNEARKHNATLRHSQSSNTLANKKW